MKIHRFAKYPLFSNDKFGFKAVSLSSQSSTVHTPHNDYSHLNKHSHPYYSDLLSSQLYLSIHHPG